MKASNATYARATGSPPSTGRSSDSRPPSPTSARSFALAGPSALPDPCFHAYRRDLADVALAGQVIASHYAEPAKRRLVASADLRAAAAEDSQVIDHILAGSCFLLLDDSLGWAWGYAGAERRVGYVKPEALG